MSSVAPDIPYVAPWAAPFTRYSTQIYPLGTGDFANIGYTIPDGQWLRVIYATMLVTGGGTGERYGRYQVLDTASNVVFEAQAGLHLTGSNSGVYSFGPGVGSTSVQGTSGAPGYGGAPIPDLVWPQGYRVRMVVQSTQAGDTVTRAFLAAEIYTEESPGVLQLAPAVTPVPIASS